MRRPDFGPYYQGPWLHHAHEGVGLELEGAPTDAVAFIDVLQGFSCAPPQARRILHMLERGEVKRTTVMTGLPFAALGDQLCKLGVTMRIIPPVSPDAVLAAKLLNDAVMIVLGGGDISLVNFTEDQKQEINQRVQEYRDSQRALPHHLGNYEGLL